MAKNTFPNIEMRFGEKLSRRAELLRALSTAGPAALWISAFMMVPILALVVVSFMSRGSYGEVILPITLNNYARFFGFGILGYDLLYPFIILRSLVLGLVTCLLCVALGLPLAFYIAGLSDRYKSLALILVMIPFWTSLLIRTYAWQILLAPDSPITGFFVMCGIIEPGESLYPSLVAVYIGMICDYLPYLVLPLYASVEKIDWSVAEAAMDLGANGFRVFRHAILPQIAAGLAAGVVLVFVPATGQYVIPDLLGGAKSIFLGNAIAQQFGQSRDWPFGSALALFSMATLLVALWLYARVARKAGEDVLL